MSDFERVDFIFLSQEEVLQVGMSMRQVIDTVEKVFYEHGVKRVENPPKPGIHPLHSAFLHAMPAYLSELQAAGMKWVSSYPTNYQHHLPAVMGVIMLNDVATGKPLAMMDCRWITAARTGAVSAVAAKYLAKPHAEVVGIVGAGVQGRFNLLALQEVLPDLRLAKYYDISADTLRLAQQKLAGKVECEVKTCSSPQEVIEGSDVIVTATGKLEQVIYFDRWVGAGALVLPVHHRGWENQVIHRADKFITDDWAQLSNAAKVVGGFDGPLPEPNAELGEIVAGQKPGRERPDERIVDFNYGLAMEDIAIAQRVYHKAQALNLGTRLVLMERDFD
ncbi:MAG: ornithine cyclodeaminase family protein [Anaerolineales bacterium]|nr:ornithine cyclodeaminase family protein [Anaerolineales bacterium]